MTRNSAAPEFDTSSDREFVDYYAKQSLSEDTRRRFASVRDKVLALIRREGRRSAPFDVLDIGCGVGVQCALWAAGGDRVSGIDVNAALIDIARRRTAASGLMIRFDVGSATALPYADASQDICLLPELLEHVPDWESCLGEAIRTLRPGGILYLSTTNFLCPVQQEFNLPLYSWYPAPLKRRYERLAVTTRPELVSHARYPAVHWFSPGGLARFLRGKGLRAYDRFDMLDGAALPAPARGLVALVRGVGVLRRLGYVATPSSTLFAVKL